MKNSIVSDHSDTTNLFAVQSILTTISDNLDKSTAMLQVAMCADFWACEQNIQYDYMWALSDLIEQTQKLCQLNLIHLKEQKNK